MAFEAESEKLKNALISCKVPDIGKAVEEAKAAGMPADEIINTLGAAMSDVGVLFERGKLFLPHVLSAAAGMKNAMTILDDELKAGAGSASAKGVAVMGTVEGDVHDIGKSICSTMLQCAGFEVHDLGRDVPLKNIVEECKNGCNYCGMSALMTTTMTGMKTVIDMLNNEGIRDKVIVMVGGAPVTQGYADKIGADLYGESASETTKKASALASD
ncbi:MAG: dimethylamine corrinoid protein 3 [Thermoplasmata archaeon]|jgi:dimethylamine corrinoid protein|nr:dimethylamine corrinoid protein 3 [Thermoplasmata archaeon]MBR4685539.1 methyltransferase cognate corrinoid protein [Candidatus Methanomethylophilaceae archaeon]WII07102.1 methyltransferase cognate corrinoid protein [Methanomassiliicoccales archaeon LGM-RCC1]